jgi:phosphinothricin acetyltransferase
MSEKTIRAASADDAAAICGIYNYYIENTTITFEEVPVTLDEMKKRIKEKSKYLPWYVYEENGKILGYVYASLFKERSAYRFTIENSIYVDKNASGRGIGKMLFDRFLSEISNAGNIHSIISVISLPNEQSVRFHEKYGFIKAGHLHQAGFKFNCWLDIGYWQLLLK